jgi:phosphatidylserine/phosphatidylglycerophosphate/cardiolipin synthase-like enzyme
MARARRRTTKSQGLKPWQLLLLVLIFCGGYLYQNGYLDRFLKQVGLSNEPTPVAVGGGNGPQVELSKAIVATGDWYQLYFTRPTYPEKAATRTGGVDDALVADIDAAKLSVKIAVFEFNRANVADAMIRAKERGLTVQMVFDAENMEDPDDADMLGRIEKAGIPVTYENSSAFMHNKIFLIDDTIVWFGSMNLTHNDVYRNNNNMIRTTVAPLVENYAQRFADLFAGKMGSKAPANTPHPVITLSNGVRIETYFSPSDGAREHLLEYLNNAKQSVTMLAFSFTDDATGQALIDLHKRGVSVQVVMETRNVEGTGSQFADLEAAGVPILRDANCYTAHNKIIVIDEKIVITGSYNFTNRAENVNDENLVIISDPTLAKLYTAEFDRLYDQAANAPRCGG